MPPSTQSVSRSSTIWVFWVLWRSRLQELPRIPVQPCDRLPRSLASGPLHLTFLRLSGSCEDILVASLSFVATFAFSMIKPEGISLYGFHRGSVASAQRPRWHCSREQAVLSTQKPVGLLASRRNKYWLLHSQVKELNPRGHSISGPVGGGSPRSPEQKPRTEKPLNTRRH